jgi:signal transduction histidine kinase
MRKGPLLSLSVKVGLALFAVVAGALAIVYVAVVPQLETRLVDAKLDELRPLASSVAREIETTELDEQTEVSLLGETLGLRIVVLEPIAEGRLRITADTELFESGGLETDEVALETARTNVLASGRVTRGEADFAEVAYPLAEERVVLLAAPLQDALANVRLVRRSLLAAGAASLGISWLVGYLLAWSFTRRLRRLESAAERLAEGDLQTPIVDAGNDEIGQLADAFDSMRARLAVLDRARGEFIANASHELRTPLFSLGGFVELLADESMEAEVRRDFLAEMRDQIDRLTRLATDLLDLSRLDAGQLQVEASPIDLAATAAAVADEFRAVADHAEHELRVEAAEAVPALGDELRVEQIARNLVENAIRHTPAGTTVAVTTGVRGDRAVLEVRDDGPGVPEEDREHLFQRFYRAAGGKASGSGLGLAIASELAARMGGAIELRSRPGRTVFTLLLPLARSETPPRPLVADVAK